MAFELRFSTSLSTNGKYLRLTETTGLYDGVMNLTGWGVSGSLSIGSINSCKLYISGSDGIEHIVDILTSNLPSSTNEFYDITSEDIGLLPNVVIPDDIYTIKYEVGIASDNDYRYTLAYVLVDREVKCCVFNKIEKVLDICDNCADKKIVQYLRTWALYKALLGGVKLGRLEKSRAILAALKKYCSQGDCGC